MYLGPMLVLVKWWLQVLLQVHDFTDCCQVFSTRHSFHVDWVLSPVREPLVTAKVCVPLLHPQGQSAVWVTSVVHRWCHSCIAFWLFLLSFGSQNDTFWYHESQSSGRRLSGQFQLGHLGPVSQVYGFCLQQQRLTFCLWWQPKVAIGYTVLGISWTTLTTKKSFSCLMLGFFVRLSLTLGGSIMNPDKENLI